MKRVLGGLLIAVLLTGAASAQIGGGRGGGGGRGAERGGAPDSRKAPPTSPTTPPPPREKPTNLIEMTGVVVAIDAAAGRITVSYDPVDELNWPHGTMPFPVDRDELLRDLKVGEKIRFRVESHTIYEIKPFSADAGRLP